MFQTATAEDIHTGKYTIDDVILPMPGSRVIYPTNEVAEVYHCLAKKVWCILDAAEAFMLLFICIEQDGISLTEIVHNVKEFSITSMTGSYRRVFQKPLDFEWELLKYTDASKPLAETDLDKIAKAKPLSIIKEEELVGGDEKKNPSDCIEEFESLENVNKLSTDDNEADCGRELRVPQFKSLHGSDSQEVQMALKLGFTLPTSCYATMAIRELLKTSTSVAFHKTLNQ
ncbi:hypothetical protein Patl1_23339 [Pistacia atlantica]|uniref:Uncharacterized protein n=1 Tax=Pistacia atlantica TaxID=434234 RepID=A0ACC0ZYW1_9ROSI|nr:hypothetical protein Patl1_23339 [Pistacia atlantica]